MFGGMLRRCTVKKVNMLLDLFDSYDLSKLSFKNNKLGVFIGYRNPKGDRPVHSVAVERVAAIESPIKIENSALKEGGAVEEKAPSRYHQVTASMTGAFYRKPKPDAEFFVKDGGVVEPDTTVCLLEAMKMFNEVKAGIRGKLVKAHAEDGDFVAEGDVLFEIQPL